MSGLLQGAVHQHGPRKGSLAYTLAVIADNADDHGLAWPSLETIAMKSRCDVRTVIRRVLALERAGWLRVERRVVSHGGSYLNGNAYFIDIRRLKVVLNAKSRRSAMWDEIEKLLKEREARRLELAQGSLDLRLAPKAVPKQDPAGANFDLFEQIDEQFRHDILSPQNPPFSDSEVTNEVTIEVTKNAFSGDKNTPSLLTKQPLEPLELPLPPQAGEPAWDEDPELIDAENNHGQGPELSFADCRFGDPRFEVNCRDAANWVLEQTGITPGVSSTRRLVMTIAEALSLGAKQTRQDLGELARKGVAHWPRYEAEVEYPLGFAKYWSMGAWRKPESWRRDPEKMAQARRNAVGTQQDFPPVDQVTVCRGYAVQLLAAADAIDASGIASDVCAEVRALAQVLETATEYDVEQLDARLQVLDSRLDEAAYSAATPEELASVTRAVANELTDFKSKWRFDVYEKARLQKINRAVRSTRKLPNLGFFYLQQHG